MRKLAAFIVLIPIAILFTGSVNLASICPGSQQVTAGHDQCCHKAKCPTKGEPRKGQTGRSSCCFDCPLCALITLPPFVQFDLILPQSTTEYAVMTEDNLSNYVQPHWKPPSPARLS